MGLVRIEASSLRGSEVGTTSRYCQLLEEGNILFFPETPVEIPHNDIEFLLALKQAGSTYHKNIAYRPRQHRVTGLATGVRGDADRVLQIMSRFSEGTIKFLTTLLPPYAGSWRVDYASFRPQEERGRKLRVEARNDLLHVDAFPTRPTNGDRILRFFTNVNPGKARRWVTGQAFEDLVTHQTGPTRMPLPSVRRSLLRRAGRRVGRLARAARLPVVVRSSYDEFMLGFHHYLKRNQDFQKNSPKSQWEFPSHSSWMVFTDLVPHAALSGQFALEQTLIVSRAAAVLPGRAPVDVLERLCGTRLTDD
ncbi:MAG: Kdo hydroxylase family protein [Acidobacteriota bacterium]